MINTGSLHSLNVRTYDLHNADGSALKRTNIQNGSFECAQPQKQEKKIVSSRCGLQLSPGRLHEEWLGAQQLVCYSGRKRGPSQLSKCDFHSRF